MWFCTVIFYYYRIVRKDKVILFEYEHVYGQNKKATK